MIDGAIQPINLTRYRLASEVHRVVTFTTLKDNEPHEVPAPADLIHEMLSVPVRDIPLPRLCRLAAAPFMDEQGGVVSRPGCYPRIQAFLDFRYPLPAICAITNTR